MIDIQNCFPALDLRVTMKILNDPDPSVVAADSALQFLSPNPSSIAYRKSPTAFVEGTLFFDVY